MSKLYAIPDIHGKFDQLEQLWSCLDFKPEEGDKVIFLGDMIDRGPKSKQVINFIRDLTIKYPNNVIALAGNHEWLAIDAKTKHAHDIHLWYINGGDRTEISYGPMRMPDEDVKWLASLPLSHEEPGFFFSHAPLPIEEQRGRYKGQPFAKVELTWTYHQPEGEYARVLDNGVIGVCGHVHALRQGVLEPRFYPHYIFADAGCGCAEDAPLVAIEVNTREVTYAYPEGFGK